MSLLPNKFTTGKFKFPKVSVCLVLFLPFLLLQHGGHGPLIPRGTPLVRCFLPCHKVHKVLVGEWPLQLKRRGERESLKGTRGVRWC